MRLRLLPLFPIHHFTTSRTQKRHDPRNVGKTGEVQEPETPSLTQVFTLPSVSLYLPRHHLFKNSGGKACANPGDAGIQTRS